MRNSQGKKLLVSHSRPPAMWRKPVHCVRSSLHSHAFSTARKRSTVFRSAALLSSPNRTTLALPPRSQAA
ncbi:hypothetical protein [Cesiribacter sp. SM1]|uniref:hypothetical protein n=1 Tax=Cesiribacter sp. SM1 TaxID=2861196 RepID=UPI001CD2A2B1|nr:hypothetical protein [Cesiribacter sp. SM1]